MADYNPSFVESEFGGLETFRAEFPRRMSEARELYDKLREMVTDASDRE